MRAGLAIGGAPLAFAAVLYLMPSPTFDLVIKTPGEHGEMHPSSGTIELKVDGVVKRAAIHPDGRAVFYDLPLDWKLAHKQVEVSTYITGYAPQRLVMSLPEGRESVITIPSPPVLHLNGMVRGAGGEPVPHARVTVLPDSDNVVFTDAVGHFEIQISISLVPSNSLRIAVTAAGYKDLDESFPITNEPIAVTLIKIAKKPTDRVRAEIDAIEASGQYAQLPEVRSLPSPDQKLAAGIVEQTVVNKTDYEATILMAGTASYSITVQPQGQKDMTIRAGTYTIVLKLNGPNIKPGLRKGQAYKSGHYSMTVFMKDDNPR
jgi:hypothetical protein